MSCTISNRDAVAIKLYDCAAALTDPICTAWYYRRQIQLVDALGPTAPKLEKVQRKARALFKMVSWSLLGALPALVAIPLRSFAKRVQTGPFFRFESQSRRVLPDRSFTLLSWNICTIASAYAISDAGVFPWETRIDRIADRIVQENADIVCLYETYWGAARRLHRSLAQQRYHHFYYQMGARGTGVSSGLFVASKHRISNPQFTQFPVDNVERSKHFTKGIFSFSPLSGTTPFARIHSTHPLHSEKPEFPKDEERTSRRTQMALVEEKITSEGIQDCPVIVTGDLNLDDAEYGILELHTRFHKHSLPPTEKTWGGDAFCASLTPGKKPSQALNLDHTLLRRGTPGTIETRLVPTGFEATRFKREALSDHAGLFSTIGL